MLTSLRRLFACAWGFERNRDVSPTTRKSQFPSSDDTPAVLPTLLFLSGAANAILSMYTPGGTDVGRCSDFS